jgi:ADP-dependent NAD(P)H-hydrate dehydratase / NAD(P)H-hydrate epimerase
MSYKKTKSEFARAFPSRNATSHKGDYGKLLLICGSKGFTGAAYLAACAAVRAGAGLVTLVVPESLNTILAVKLTEVMTLPICDNGKGFLLSDNMNEIMKNMDNKDVLGIGPGLGCNESTAQLVREVYVRCDKPIVLDADGLNAFIGRKDSLRKQQGQVIITPHTGEFERLFGKSNVSREDRALAEARDLGLVVVLKGTHTVVASPKGDLYVNTTGNPGMASGGTGDCLLGIITAFVGLKLSLFEAAKFGVFVHGLAGDIACDEYGEISMNATDLLNALPQAFLRLTR